MGLFYQWIDRGKFKEIFRTHWKFFKETYSRYQTARYDEAVQKMLGCGDPKNGYATYVCSACGGDRKKVPFSCKSCFCLSCGKVYTDQWAARIEAILFPGVAYRHTVLTVQDELRIYFYKDAGLLSECSGTSKVARKQYRQRVMETSSNDPSICSRCGGELILWKI